MEKFYRLAAIALLIMVVKPAYCATIGDFDLPDAPKTEAQMYYDQIPVESKLEKFSAQLKNPRGKFFDNRAQCRNSFSKKSSF